MLAKLLGEFDAVPSACHLWPSDARLSEDVLKAKVEFEVFRKPWLPSKRWFSPWFPIQGRSGSSDL